MLFLKPSTSYVQEPHPIVYARGVDLHHEVELGVIIGKEARNVSKMAAMNYVGGYCLALDMTARNIQDAAKKAGLPWLLAKGQDTWCAVSSFIAAKDIPDPGKVQLRLDVNGTLRQDGNTQDMIFSVPDLIEYISKHITLEGAFSHHLAGSAAAPHRLYLCRTPCIDSACFRAAILRLRQLLITALFVEGDVILTGTPAGVGPVKHGDSINAALSISGKIVTKMSFKVEEKSAKL